MKYHIDIIVKSSTTRLGEMLTPAVLSRYDGALLTRKQAEKIPLWLERQIAELCGQNKRLKPMTVKVNGSFAGDTVVIHTVTEIGAKAFEDNRPFTMYLYPVKKDHTADPAELLQYDDAVIMGNTFDTLKAARYSILQQWEPLKPWTQTKS